MKKTNRDFNNNNNNNNKNETINNLKKTIKTTLIKEN